MEAAGKQAGVVGVGNEEGGGGSKGPGLACGRQSSSRWTPTSDQIRILKELYYNNGVRSPSADQIQRISARLRQYGKIEGKNVFYWFQNHKARERQKKRFTSTSTSTSNNSSASTTSDHHHHHHHLLSIPLPKQSPSINTAPSSSVMVAVGHMGHYGPYGSATVDNTFRDCSISTGGSSGLMGSRMGWIGVDPYSAQAASSFFEKTKSVEESMEDGGQEIETLPLFPIHGDRNLGAAFCNMKPEYNSDAGYYTTAWYGRPDDGAAGSLELSLNSYAAISPDDAI